MTDNCYYYVFAYKPRLHSRLVFNYFIQVGKSKNAALDSIADQVDDVAVEGLSIAYV